MKEIVYRGSEIKINVSVHSVDGLTMDDYNFTCTFHTVGKSVTLAKEKMVRKDQNNYVAVVDSALLNFGQIKIKIEAQLPDSDVFDGIRTEVICIDTNIFLQPCYS